MTRTRAVILAAVLAVSTSALGVGVAVLNGEEPEPHEYASIVVEESGTVPGIHLATADGEPFVLGEAGGLEVVYFGYTHCPDVCPLTMQDLRATLTALPEDRRDDVRVVMVTVDPERDTPEVMEQYVGYFDESFVGLSGTPDAVEHVLTTWSIQTERGEVGEGGSYFMSHPAGVYVVDSEQRLRLVIPPGLEPEVVAADLLHLLQSG